MFVNSDYLNYDNVVEYSDNYVCLAKTSGVSADWQNPVTIDVVYQYFYPSTLTIEGERRFTSSQDFDYIDVTDNFWERADCPIIFIAGFILTFFLILILNGFTKIGKKGGIFFGQ